jgi:hypothetical protein
VTVWTVTLVVLKLELDESAWVYRNTADKGRIDSFPKVNKRKWNLRYASPMFRFLLYTLVWLG